MNAVRSIVAGVLCLAAGVAAAANTWYASPNGNNDNVGYASDELDGTTSAGSGAGGRLDDDGKL